MSAQPLVHRNDWRSLDVPALGAWTPTKTVSVVVLAWNPTCLDTVLAALAAQTYPADLLEVVVVDDGNTPALELPELRPAHTRVVRPDAGWGCANGVVTGFGAATGEILMRLDDDMLAFADHVEAHARWHHVIDHAVVMGDKRFVDPEVGLDPAQVRDAVADGSIATLHDWDAAQRHTWVEAVWDKTDDLASAGVTVGRLVVGATVSLTRALWEASGGIDPTLRTGEDTLLGYRALQAGAVLVADRDAKAWHLGLSTAMEVGGGDVNRYNWPVFADFVPTLRTRRVRAGRFYDVPWLEVVVRAEGDLVAVQTQVDALLDSDFTDVRVVVVGAWSSLSNDRVSPLKDPLRDLGILHRSFRNEPRVELREDGDPVLAGRCRSPFRMTVHDVRLLPSEVTLRLVMADMGRTHQGIRTFVDEQGAPVVQIVSTAALARADWHGVSAPAEVEALVAEAFGASTRPAHDAGWLAEEFRPVRFHPATPDTAVEEERSWAKLTAEVDKQLGRRRTEDGSPLFPIGKGAKPAPKKKPASKAPAPVPVPAPAPASPVQQARSLAGRVVRKLKG